MNKLWPAALVCALFPAVVACASSDDDSPAAKLGATGGTSGASGGTGGTSGATGGAKSTGGTTATGGAKATGGASATGGATAAGDAQNPPTTNGADVEAWLKTNAYKAWKCETAAHSAAPIVSPHGKNRVCSNDLAAGFTGAVGTERPIKTASVKELYDDASKLVGYAVAVKTKATSDAGSSWYWYERMGTAAAAADGLGSSGVPKDVCVGCHVGAGSDAMHTVMGSSDYVYLQAGP